MTPHINMLLLQGMYINMVLLGTCPLISMLLLGTCLLINMLLLGTRPHINMPRTCPLIIMLLLWTCPHINMLLLWTCLLISMLLLGICPHINMLLLRMQNQYMLLLGIRDLSLCLCAAAAARDKRYIIMTPLIIMNMPGMWDFPLK